MYESRKIVPFGENWSSGSVRANSMSPSAVARAPVEIFISYSHHDIEYARQLHKHLRGFERANRIRVWYDRNLRPGTAWEPELFERFNAAQIVLFLISSDFLDSDYIFQRELPRALDRYKSEAIKLVPVLIRPVDWMHLPLSHFQALPRGAVPVQSWANPDEAYAQIAREIQNLLESEFAIIGEPDLSTPLSDHGNGGAGTATTFDAIPTVPAPQVPAQPPTPPQNDRPVAINPAAPQAVPDAIVPELVVCYLNAERRRKLPGLKKWCLQPGDPLFSGSAARVVEFPSLSESIQYVRQRPQESILLLDGFEPRLAQVDELLHPADRKGPGVELIVNDPEWNSVADQGASASIVCPRATVATDQTLPGVLRKSILRIRTRAIATARAIGSEAELADFFALRFRVWKAENYLPATKIDPKVEWELDFTDRTSLPLGIFSKSDGRLLAAARLVRGFGDENPSLIRRIDEMLQAKAAAILQGHFRNPQNRPQNPFDILGEMAQFNEYYRDLVRKGTRKAEVSRVIVSPEWRSRGMGEVVVDTLCSLAKCHGIELLFLACHAKHAGFYERCGFAVIPGMTGPRFLTYDGPCIAMDRHL